MASNQQNKKKQDSKKKPAPQQQTQAITPVGFLYEKAKALQHYVPQHATAETIIRSALLAFNESWQLQKTMESEKGRNSVYNAMARACSTGLSLNPMEGKAALVPYKGQGGYTVSYQVMKNGIIELAHTSGRVDHISADTVRENDTFSMQKVAAGDDFDFSPALTGRGDIIGMYASVKLKSGSSHVQYMSWEEIEEHRDQYSASYNYDQRENKSTSPWTTSPEGMGIKTVLKKLFRNNSVSPEMTKAVMADDESESGMVIDITAAKTSGPEDVAAQLDAQESAAAAEAAQNSQVPDGDGEISGSDPSKAGF